MAARGGDGGMRGHVHGGVVRDMERPSGDEAALDGLKAAEVFRDNKQGHL